ncbi:DoxX family membrane protein [Salipaludibacillus sp. LMS25]|uniref:DoxX family membrane protein n=1 Tax=Salipaludibacillus sp. LMS25 TaxID=2924031 RepID=UPI0020D034F4|nr:DoxX family membrane protein [Salipaludibacillus sp. LMS25]UTR16562.1 DoxX family membrane protein [Salipaludibacillus sp. LMS25]
MFMDFLRNNKIAAGILTVLRVYIGWQWLSAGWGKITGEQFDASGYLMGVVNNEAVIETYPTYHAFIENFALPNAGMFSFMVAWGEVLVGLGLVLGVLTTAAVFFGMTMNFAFMFAGTVSTNPWLILLSIFVIVAGYNAGRYGGDRWVIPYIRTVVFKNKFTKHEVQAA